MAASAPSSSTRPWRAACAPATRRRPRSRATSRRSERRRERAIGWLKLFADGALGSRSGAVLAPYADRGGRGRLLIDPRALGDLVARAAQAGLAPQIHVIGDRAMRMALDVLERVPAARGGRRWARLEHVQLATAADVARLGRLRVAASVQPAHLLHDAAMARRAWPHRQARAYRWASLAATGVPLAFGTDAPVESPDPWPGIATAVTRRLPGEAAAVPRRRRADAGARDPGRGARPAAHRRRGRRGRSAAGRAIARTLIVIPAEALAEPVRRAAPWPPVGRYSPCSMARRWPEPATSTADASGARSAARLAPSVNSGRGRVGRASFHSPDATASGGSAFRRAFHGRAPSLLPPGANEVRSSPRAGRGTLRRTTGRGVG